MTIQRLTPFGFPMQGRPHQSSTTVRMVPLTQGIRTNQPFTERPAGSASTLVNFVPMDGKLAPRSRLSSLGTVHPTGPVMGITETSGADGQVPLMWVSTQSQYGVIDFFGDFSAASFVSAAGFGTKPSGSYQYPDFAQIYSTFDPSIRNNILIIADGSYDTLMVAGVRSGGGPEYSYLTGAPRALHVGVFDNYVLAWSIKEGSALTGIAYKNRVRWSARGDIDIWDPADPIGGAGFEDLLQMHGNGSKVCTLDNRVILFSTEEIWYAIPSASPAQFQFVPLDTQCGGPYPGTIIETEFGIVFLGTDRRLRLLPKGGGLSQSISDAVDEIIRNNLSDTDAQEAFEDTWGWYDANRRIYRLLLSALDGSQLVLVLNLATGEWGLDKYNVRIRRGAFVKRLGIPASFGGQGLFAGSTGMVYSTNSLIASELSQPVTSTWRSEPVGMDLPAGQRQVNGVQFNYRASNSNSSGTMQISGDFGNTFEPRGQGAQLSRATFGALQRFDTGIDGPAPVLQWQSESTGYELHRMEATIGLRGRV